MKRRAVDSYDDETEDSDNHSGAEEGNDDRLDTAQGGSSATSATAAAAAVVTNGHSSSAALSVDDYKQRCRELNRISKIRCRQRRKERVRELEATIASLSSEHQSLQVENAQLRQEFSECCNSAQQPLPPVRQQQQQQQHRMPVAQMPMFHQSPALAAAAAAPSSSAHLFQFPGAFNVAPPNWDNNQLAWLGAQQQQQQQTMVPTPSQQVLTIGAQQQNNQLLDPRLIPFLASLQNGDPSSIFQNAVARPPTQHSDYAQVPQGTAANAMSDWIQLLQNHQQQGTPSQQQQTFQPGIPERFYEASSEHSSEESGSKNASV